MTRTTGKRERIAIFGATRHRAMKDHRIVDLRVFGYFSRFIDLDAKSLMSEIITCVKNCKEFVTGPDDIVRDYIHPEDLASLVKLCIAKRDLNDAFDVCSLHPARKFEILEKYSSLYGLRYAMRATHNALSATGNKTNYYSTNRKVRTIGFAPQHISLETLCQESKLIMGSR
jgi:nucleoside-diphosphate-sugar epimerase